MTIRWWLLPAALAVGPPATLVLVRASLPDPARHLFDARLLYWTMPVVVIAAAVAWAWRWRRAAMTVREAVHVWWPGLLFACIATAFVFVLVPPAMRVQFDETSLVNVSMNMHEQRAAAMTTGAVPFEGGITRLENTIDKRPPLFSFLVSVMHDLTGARVANAYAVNALLLATALSLAFAAARARLGLAAALMAPLLLLAVPLTVVVATSAGFDLLAAVLFGVVLLAARDFVAAPDSVRFVALLAGGMVFAQARYESLIAFAVVGALALWQARGRWVPTRAAKLALALCPGLLTPLWFLLEIARSPNFYPEAGGGPLVSWRHAVDHAGPFLAALFAPSLASPLPGALAIVAVVAWVAHLARGRGSRRDLLVVVPVLAVTALALAWFFGDVRDVSATRLFLPCAWLAALSPLLLASLWPRLSPWLLAAAALLCGLRVHEVQRGAAFPQLDGAKFANAVEAATRQPGIDPNTTLWITTAALHLATLGHGALCPLSFVNRGAQIRQLLGDGRVKAIFVLETPLDRDLAPAFGDPAALLQGRPAALVARVAGEVPIDVHRIH